VCGVCVLLLCFVRVSKHNKNKREEACNCNKSLVAGHYVFAFSVESVVLSVVLHILKLKSVQKNEREERENMFVRFGTLLEPLLPESA
jgi:hypothetical protein